MKRSQKTLSLSLLVVYGVLPMHQDAHAYLDPGTGSFIFQIALAAFLAAMGTVKFWWKKMIMIISGLLSKSKNKEKYDK